MTEASRRIRAHLDTELVVRAAADEIRRALGSGRTRVWLTTGRGTARLAVAIPPPSAGEDLAPPPPVARSARRGRAVWNAEDEVLAVPVRAPQSGLVGVICVEGVPLDRGARRYVEDIAHETGFALEAANLYEQAVAERDKSEAILARVGDAVVVTDPRGTILAWNPGAERVGGRPAAEAIGRRCHEILGLRAGDREVECGHGCGLLARRAADGSILGVEVWRAREDGRRQPLLADVSAVRDADGNVSEIVHSLRDITRLKEADEAKTMFLATASHELKTPLTVIQGFSQTLLSMSEWGAEERENALRAMVRRSKELNRIVDRLLLSSRIEAGRAEVSVRGVDVAPILADRVETLARATGRDIRLDASTAIPVCRADPEALGIVVDHLLDNAVKYSPATAPVVVRAGSDETYVTISVTDAGIGMDDEQAARCFEKFWQAESSDDRRFGGTGIGLFIVRSLVEAMHGTVRVETAPGRGSTFVVSLVGPEAAPPAQAPLAPQPGIGERSVIREFMRQIGIPAKEGS